MAGHLLDGAKGGGTDGGGGGRGRGIDADVDGGATPDCGVESISVCRVVVGSGGGGCG